MVTTHDLVKVLAPLRRRVLLMIGRAVLRAVDDAGGLQRVQVEGFAGELLSDRDRWQAYGVTSHPHPGADALILSPGGQRSAAAILVDDRRYRLKALAAGEVALYDDLGQVVRLKRNGIAVDSPLNIRLTTDGVLRLEGDGVEIHGRTYVQTDVAGKGARETHGGGVWHTDSHTAGAVTTATEHGLDVPHIPSDHPEGP